MASIQANRNIKITTPLGDDVLLLHRMAGREAMSELGEFHADLLSEQSDVAIDDVLGQVVSMSCQRENGEARQFNGIVTRFIMTGRQGRYATYQATIRPWLWFLTRTADCRIFQEKSVVDIIKTIFEKYSIADFDLANLSATYPALGYCVQYRETDFAFVSRLMERNGIFYYFRHSAGRHTMVLADSFAAHQKIENDANLDFAPNDEAARRAGEVVYEFNTCCEILSDQVTLRAFDFEKPSTLLTAKTVVPIGHVTGASGLEIYDYPGSFTVQEDGNKETSLRIGSIDAAHQTVQGRATAQAMSPGGLFTLGEHPRSDQNGELLVLACDYRLHSDDFQAALNMATPSRARDGNGPAQASERLQGGPGATPPQGMGNPAPRAPQTPEWGDLAPLPFDCQFTALAKEFTFRPPQTTPRPVMRGPQTAIVVGKSGEEIWTDSYGRIKVQFHWDRDGKDDEGSSCWVRVSQAWAGKRWGHLFIPRIGQEVIVSFLEGDPDRPLVTGSVYNGDNMPPVDLPAQASRSIIKTNSTKGGEGYNQIGFEDKKGEEILHMHAEKDQVLWVKNDALEWIGNNQHEVVKKDKNEEVGGNKSSKVTGNYSCSAGGTVSMDAGGDVFCKAGKNIASDAGMDVHIKAGINMVLEAGAIITLKAGGSSIVIGPTGVSITGAMVLINSGGSPGSGGGANVKAPDAAEVPVTGGI